MVGTVKAKVTIYCNTCGCPMQRTKSIKVKAVAKESAINEAREKAQEWKASLAGKNCKTCQSILDYTTNVGFKPSY